MLGYYNLNLVPGQQSEHEIKTMHEVQITT